MMTVGLLLKYTTPHITQHTTAAAEAPHTKIIKTLPNKK
jgi:hypothetical protein